MARFAGVLPYAYDHEQRLHFLLARELYGRERGSWSGFAGGIQARDGTLLRSAAREAFEESSGLLGSSDVLAQLLATNGKEIVVTAGVHFLLPIQYNQYLPFMFSGVQDAINCAVKGTAACGRYSPLLEKDQLRWFVEDELCVPGKWSFRRGFLDDVPFLLAGVKSL
jgi:hypothetical protein